MVNRTTTSLIKKSQRESLLFKEISHLFQQACLDDTRLVGLSVSRVQISRDKGICTVFFYTPEGLEFFKQKLPFLILYKPSMRKALARSVAGRYTPELIFKFDMTYEKQERMEALFEKIKQVDKA